MSEYDEEKNEEQPGDAPRARVHLAKWSPWVWLVPVAAVFFVGWLVVRYGFFGGGDITVHFAEARGLDRYSPVKFRGAKVGTVQKITIDEKLSEVVVRISMDASMNHALRKGTRFWIVEPGLESGGLGGLLAGTYVGMAPGTGDETREFTGQEYGPVLSAPEPGKTFILQAHSAGSVSLGSPVQFQGMRVGRVLGTEYDDKRRITAIHVFVVDRFAGHVRQSTRFWRGGGLTISLGGGGLSMGDASLTSLLISPLSFYTPEVMAGATASEGTRFQLYESRAAAIAASDGPHLTYLTYFPGPVNGLTAGTPVQMKGVQVGRVREVRLRYVAATASLVTPVTLEIDPRVLDLEVSASTTREDLRRRMNDALESLIRKGMRARLSSSLVLPGASAVVLEMAAAPGTGRLLVANDPPIIPAAADDNGLAGAMASLSEVAATVRSLPLREIAASMRSAAQRADALLNDPILDESLRRLNASLIEIEKAAVTTNRNIEPIAQSLRSAAASAEAAAKRAEQLMGTSQRQNYDLAELIRELTRAAEAVRSLASYLTENPDSLLKGRRE